MMPPVMGSLIEFHNLRGEVAFRIYITGDTVLDELKEIPRRFPDIDLALLHLGGTMFFGLLLVTMDPKQGVEVIRLVKPKTAIPIHYDDYTAFEFALGDTSHSPCDRPRNGGTGRRSPHSRSLSRWRKRPREAPRYISFAAARRTPSRSPRVGVERPNADHH